MKIVIFGASGFVGRNMVNRLSKENEVIATDITKVDFPPNVNFIRSDITDYDEVCNVVKDNDVVIHLAASSLTKSLENPLQNAKINIIGTLNILEACRKFGIKKIIYSSASSIIGDVIRNPVDEEHSCHPRTPYAVSKLTAENYIKIYKDIHNLDYLIFRFYNLYGPYQYPESGGLIPMIFKKILNNEPILVFGDGSAVRDFIYVQDVVEFYIKALEMNVKNEILNMGTGKGSTIMDVIQNISKVTKTKPRIDYKPARKGEIANFVADTKRLEDIFNEKPETDLLEGLKKTYEWFKKECV